MLRCDDASQGLLGYWYTSISTSAKLSSLVTLDFPGALHVPSRMTVAERFPSWQPLARYPASTATLQA